MGSLVGDPYIPDRPPRQYWPACPSHPGLLVRASDDGKWLYCKIWGWHPSDLWETEQFFLNDKKRDKEGKDEY